MATLEKWTPLPDLDTVERRMRRLFADLVLPLSVMPAADIYEDNDELTVELEVPGFGEKELGVDVSDHMLTVTGERKLETETPAKNVRMHERLEANFERRFRLPAEADTEHVTAEYSKGVLTLHVPKVPAKKGRGVKIVTK